MGRKSKKNVKFYFGFPIEESEEQGQECNSNRGVAMLVALLVTAMVMLFLTELKLSSAVALRLALGNHLNTKGEYVAKSGANLGAFLITSDLALELTVFELAPGTPIPPIWSQINGLPIGGDTLELLSTFQENFKLSSIADSKVLDQLKELGGSFILNVEDESAKININFCAVGRGQKCMEMLEALLSCPAEREYLERKKIIAKDLIMMVRDYVDQDNRPITGANYSSEEDPYENIDKEGLGPKNARFDSIEELRLIPGWDADMHKIFSPYLTVFPNPPTDVQESRLFVNFNSVSRELLGCLLPRSIRECPESSTKSYNNREDNGPIANYEETKNRLSREYCSADEKLAKQFTYRTDIFRVNVEALVEDQTRKLSMVLQRGVPDEIDLKDEFKGTYKYLYWKML